MRINGKETLYLLKYRKTNSNCKNRRHNNLNQNTCSELPGNMYMLFSKPYNMHKAICPLSAKIHIIKADGQYYLCVLHIVYPNCSRKSITKWKNMDKNIGNFAKPSFYPCFLLFFPVFQPNLPSFLPLFSHSGQASVPSRQKLDLWAARFYNKDNVREAYPANFYFYSSGCCPSCALHWQSVSSSPENTALKEDSSGEQA